MVGISFLPHLWVQHKDTIVPCIGLELNMELVWSKKIGYRAKTPDSLSVM